MNISRALSIGRDGLLALLTPYLRRRPRRAAWVLRAVRLVPLASARARVYRSFSWPLVRKLDMRLLITTAGGRVEADTGDVVGQVVAVSGVWEPNTTEVIRRLLTSGDVFIDLGAHIGYFSILAANIVGGLGHVFSFEPSPARYRQLLSNLERSGATNVTAFNVAAGRGGGTAILHEAPRPNTSASTLSAGALANPVVATAEDYEPVEVSVVAAESLVPPELWSRVRVVKVDVEGHEIEALHGLEHILALGSPAAVVVEVSPQWSAGSPTAVEQLCARHGFDPWLIENEYTPVGYFPTRLRPPVRLSAIPTARCDLLLLRGFDPAMVGAGGEWS